MKIDIINKTEYKIDKSIIIKAINAVTANLSEDDKAPLREGGVAEGDGGSHCEISIAIVPPAEIRALNHQYRGQDKVTDCLSFPMHENNILGDIIICYETLLLQAEKIGNTPSQELAFLTVHSMLHLLG